MTTRKSGRINSIKLKHIASVQKKCLFCTSNDTSEISKIPSPPFNIDEVEGRESTRRDHEDELELQRQQRSSTRFKSQEETATNPASNLSYSCATLEDQLKSIFILQKLLDISGEKLQHYLETYGDNPDTWFNVCARCREIVGECIFLHRKITRLARIFKSKKYSLQKLICQSRENFKRDRDWKKTKLTYNEDEDELELGVFFDVRKNFEMVDTAFTNPPPADSLPPPAAEPAIEDPLGDDYDQWGMAEPDLEQPRSPEVEQDPSIPILLASSLDSEQLDNLSNSESSAEVSSPDPKPTGDIPKKNKPGRKKKPKKTFRCKFPWCNFTTQAASESNKHALMHKRGRHKKDKPPQPKSERKFIFKDMSPSPPPGDSEFEDDSNDEDWAPRDYDLKKSSEVEIVQKTVEVLKPKYKSIKSKTPTDTPLLKMEGEIDKPLNLTTSSYNVEETTSSVPLEKEIEEVESNEKMYFVCTECPARFTKFSARRKHITRMHRKRQGTKCPDCEVFVPRETLCYHRLKEHKVTPKKVRVLRILAPELEEMLKQKHHDIKTNFKAMAIPFYCEAPNCQMIYTSPSHIATHMKSHHKEVPLVPCEYCERQFETKQLLKLHCLINHKDRTGSEAWASLEGEFPQPEQCKFCEEIFPSKWKMDYHIARMHSNELLKCPEDGCEYYAGKYSRYIQHFERKHLGRSYRCDICSRLLATSNSLESHKRTEHFLELGLEAIICETCGAHFGSQGALEGHINKVHLKQNPIQIRDYICHECGKDFARKTNLDKHYRTHHGDNERSNKPAKKEEGPVSCSYCEVVLANKTGLARHNRRFHSDKLHNICRKCGKGFVFLSVLFRHQNECNGKAPKKRSPRRRKTTKKRASTSNDGTLTTHEGNWVDNSNSEMKDEVGVRATEDVKMDPFGDLQSYQFHYNMNTHHQY